MSLSFSSLPTLPPPAVYFLPPRPAVSNLQKEREARSADFRKRSAEKASHYLISRDSFSQHTIVPPTQGAKLDGLQARRPSHEELEQQHRELVATLRKQGQRRQQKHVLPISRTMSGPDIGPRPAGKSEHRARISSSVSSRRTNSASTATKTGAKPVQITQLVPMFPE
eukprot:m.87995 g.87995  ORF g.87995 m.87995 type:complete len:168 (+) comp21436_c0_seq2:76-579(+)